MASKRTQLHIVNNVEQALSLSHELDAGGIGFDLEGVLRPFVGNTLSKEQIDNTLNSYSSLDAIVNADIEAHKGGVNYGIMTNNLNTVPRTGSEPAARGIVELVASIYDIPYIHTGYNHGTGSVQLTDYIEAKPDGMMGRALAKKLNVNPAEMVLIDDQGIKNFGAAANAGFKAIIAPYPIGEKNWFGMTIEHKGVMASRLFENIINRSVRGNGRLADFVMKRISDSRGTPVIRAHDIDGPYDHTK